MGCLWWLISPWHRHKVRPAPTAPLHAAAQHAAHSSPFPAWPNQGSRRPAQKLVIEDGQKVTLGLGSGCRVELQTKVRRRLRKVLQFYGEGVVSIVSYSHLSLMITASVSQFDVYLLWVLQFSIVFYGHPSLMTFALVFQFHVYILCFNAHSA